MKGLKFKSQFKIIVLTMLLILTATACGTIFLNTEVNADEEKIILRDINYQITGVYGLMSSYDTSLYFDVEGGLKMENKIPILAYQNNNGSNQRFIFNVVDSNDTSYIYNFFPNYTMNYCLDISAASSADGAKLQLYECNNTVAQKFIIKEVYEKVNSNYQYRGYVILTGATKYGKVLAIDNNSKIVQQTFNKNKLDKKQIWFLDKAFSGYAYDQAGYLDDNKSYGVYNSINYTLSNDNGGFYLDTNYWSKFEDFLSITKSGNWDPQKTRITEMGYTFFDSATLDVTIKNALSERYLKFLWEEKYVSVAEDNSEIVNNKYTGGKVGKGCVEVEYIDNNDKSVSKFTNNVFAISDKTLTYSNTFGNHCFDKVGRYVVRVYYKVNAKIHTYVMKEFSFAIGSSSFDCDAVKVASDEGEKKEDSVLSSYTLTLDKSNNIQVKYDGKEEFRANNDELIDYLTNSYNVSLEQKTKNINQLKSNIKKYKNYKIYFTNAGFYLSSGGNKFVQITENAIGYNTSATSMCFDKTSVHVTDGIYEFVSSNLYVNGVNYYRVLIQCEPNKQVFRNVTYCFSDDEGKVINYAIDYAFLEDLKIFPYTMTLGITYQNLSSDVVNKEIEYKSNSIIYNTTNDILKLKFTIKDISGNKTTLYLNIFPSSSPSLNEERMLKESYKYNSVLDGFAIDILGTKYLFSTKEVAFENFASKIIQQVCEKNAENQYILSYQDRHEQFEDNAALTEYLYEWFDETIEKVAIKSNEINQYCIIEKSMHYDTLYLNKNFYFTTTNQLPLFESYKIYFAYYNNQNILLKEGVITYDGNYKYGQSMFKILADEKEEDWIDGYVKFSEYNISANKGNDYVAYIINSNSDVELKTKAGTKYTKQTYNQTTNLTCEEFLISHEPRQDTTYIIDDNSNKVIINSNNYKEMKFSTPGEYTLTIINTHGFEYAINITVHGLSTYVDGVDNFETTTNTVTFRSKDFNFKCYINGKLQNNNNYEKIVDGEYIYKFEKSKVDKNVYLVKDFMQFAFLIKGDERFETTPYYTYESVYATPSMVREYRETFKEQLDDIGKRVTTLDQLIMNADHEKFVYLNSNASQFNQYVNYINKSKQYADENRIIVEDLNSSNNLLLKENANYVKVFELQNAIKKLDNKILDQTKKLKSFAVEYFYDQNIVLPEELIENITNYKEKDIVDYYTNYCKNLSKYVATKNKLDTILQKIKTYVNLDDFYKEKIEFIASNYDEESKLFKYIEIAKEMSDVQKSYNGNILQLKIKINTLSINNSSNPFLKDIINDFKTTKNEALNLIKANNSLDLSDALSEIKTKIFSAVIKEKNQISNNNSIISDAYQAEMEIINQKESEKEWWKIFTNIERDKAIKNARKNIEKQYSENKKYFYKTESRLTKIVSELDQLSKSNSNLIEKDMIITLQTLLDQTKSLNKQLKGEI